MRPYLSSMKMSASLLNGFVTYSDEPGSGTALVAGKLLSLPEPPSPSLEFGSLVHAFMEEYLNRVVKAGTATQEAVLAHAQEQIDHMEFVTEEKQQMHQRLDLLAEHFIPKLHDIIDEDKCELAVEQWVDATVHNVPLVGKCDMLCIDQGKKTIVVYDFKTGKPSGDSSLGAGYIRQLQFYKLLIENSSQYSGYEVLGGADLFVEPDRALGFELHEPHMDTVQTADIEHLQLLIRAVWWRIQNGLFSTGAFNASACLAEVGPQAGKDELQQAFEQWLIEDWQQHATNEAATLVIP
jgi:hypothetical protein